MQSQIYAWVEFELESTQKSRSKHLVSCDTAGIFPTCGRMYEDSGPVSS